MGGPPYKCPDCGVWWAGPEHRCAPTVTTTGTPLVGPQPWPTQSLGLVCTCDRIPPNYIGDWFCPVYIGDWFCPVHHVTVTYS